MNHLVCGPCGYQVATLVELLAHNAATHRRYARFEGEPEPYRIVEAPGNGTFQCGCGRAVGRHGSRQHKAACKAVRA